MARAGALGAEFDDWGRVKQRDQTERSDAERAIASVLDAERAAQAAVEAAQRDAEAIRAEARACDKRIAERAAGRIAAIRVGMAQQRSARVAALEAEAVGPDPRVAQDEAARAHLASAVAQLAEELTGADVVPE